MQAQCNFASALLVEDENHLAAALRIALKKLGIQANLASTLKEARKEFERTRPDFILLDRALPDGDGLELCSELRASGYVGVILMLTAKGETPDRVAGLRGGADDYLVKPFSWEELGARIEALSRRRPTPEPMPTGANHRSWLCDEKRLRILCAVGWVELTPLEFKLATHLIRSQGSIVSRQDLLKHVWGFTLLPKTRTVDHFMGRLRKLFETDPEAPKHFLTVRGAGYRFEP